MTAAEIAERFHARPSRDGWIARCPGPLHAHRDRNPSLSIREGEGGQTLVHCFVGCRTEDVCAAVGIKMFDLFCAPGRVQPKPRAVREAERRIADLRSRLTPRDRERSVTVVLAARESVDAAIARALALTVEGDLVQVTLKEDHK